jgi:hypothetical protein
VVVISSVFFLLEYLSGSGMLAMTESMTETVMPKPGESV